MADVQTWQGQIENRNFLSPIGFKFILADFPKVTYFSQTCNIPGITVGEVNQPTIFGRPIPFDSHGLTYPMNAAAIIKT